MSDMLQIMPVTKVKHGLLDIVKTMQEEDSTITLTRNGEAVGVIARIKIQIKDCLDDFSIFSN